MNGRDDRVQDVSAWEILDSRGNPTLAVAVTLEGGVVEEAALPSGASTGALEAVELRDAEPRYRGKGVRRALAHAIGPLARAVRGMRAGDLEKIDGALLRADGTDRLERMGANAVLGVSLACARAAARASGVALYRHFATCLESDLLRMPVPLLNVLNGGAHADNGLDVQEFLVAPLGLGTFAEALRAGVEVYHALGEVLGARGLSTEVGDEGGFAPRVGSTSEALDLVVQAIEVAGYEPGGEVALALDVAATGLATETGYRLDGEILPAEALVARYASWVDRYPIYSIEDGLGEEDWEGWRLLTARLGERVQLVGDDLFVTNVTRLQRGISEDVADAVLVKPNQIGTLSGTLACVRQAHAASYAAIISHRSGETEDTTIADLAVGLATGQIKAGAPCRGERTAKYNRLLRIEAELAGGVPFGLRGGRG